MKKLTVTIGIPAFNEAANIGYLLKDILSQQQKGYEIEQIIVASDASTDKTVTICKSFKDARIVVLQSATRQGQTYRQNQIISKTTADILILINADVEIRDSHFIAKLIQPIVSGGADLVSCGIEDLEPNTFFEKVITVSMKMKKKINEEFRKGLHIYTCTGRARAFSKRLYKNFKFPAIVGEDAYSYLHAKQHGFNYGYVKDTVIYSRCPDNLKDHERQSVRFIQSKKAMERLFGVEFTRQQYRLPKKSSTKALLESLSFYPFHTVCYLGILIWMHLRSSRVNYTSNIWEIATSSKVLRRERVKSL